MLKIKDNVDLEILNILGFYECDEFGVINYRYEKYPFCLRISNSRIIILEHEQIDKMFGEVDDRVITKLYDLIKADLVEKVDERLNDEVEILEEDKKDEEIELYVNGEKVDITDICEPLKQGEFFYKENGKWYIHKLKNVSFAIEEEKKIPEKLEIEQDTPNSNYYIRNEYGTKCALTKHSKIIADKVNQLIDYLNSKGE